MLVVGGLVALAFGWLSGVVLGRIALGRRIPVAAVGPAHLAPTAHEAELPAGEAAASLAPAGP